MSRADAKLRLGDVAEKTKQEEALPARERVFMPKAARFSAFRPLPQNVHGAAAGVLCDVCKDAWPVLLDGDRHCNPARRTAETLVKAIHGRLHFIRAAPRDAMKVHADAAILGTFDAMKRDVELQEEAEFFHAISDLPLDLPKPLPQFLRAKGVGSTREIPGGLQNRREMRLLITRLGLDGLQQIPGP